MSTQKKASIFSQLPKPALIGGGIVIILLIIAVIFFFSSGKEDKGEIKQQDKPEVQEQQTKKVARKIDGVLVSEGEENKPLIGVMIENHLDARPQSGLSAAQLVIEAPVEGGITRYLAFFDLSENVDVIGPVRSARPYYLDWAQGIAAVYAHVGGSPEALRKLSSYDFLDLDQFYKSDYFWRANDRFAPHNVYTSTEMLKKVVQDFDIQPKTFDMWKYKEGEKVQGEATTEVTVAYTTAAADQVKWVYEEKTNSYIRHLNGGTDKDRESEKMIMASNILVLDYPILIIDEEGRRRIDVLGEGKAYIFIDGVRIEGIWKQESKDGRMHVFTKDNQEIALNPGATWIEVVDVFDKVSFK